MLMLLKNTRLRNLETVLAKPNVFQNLATSPRGGGGVSWTDTVTQPRPGTSHSGQICPTLPGVPPGNGAPTPASARPPHGEGGPTRGASGWVLCATISSSCCCSGLTAVSPEEGPGLPELVLEELAGASLGGKTEAGLPSPVVRGHVRHTQLGALGTPDAGSEAREDGRACAGPLPGPSPGLSGCLAPQGCLGVTAFMFSIFF